MVKKKLGVFVLLLSLVFTLSLVSASTIDLIGSNPSGTDGTVIAFSINLTSNETNDVYVNWSTTDSAVITSLAAADNYTTGSHTVSGFEITIPESGSSRTLRAHFYNSSDMSFLYERSETINFNVEAAPEETACFFELGVDEDGDLEISDFDLDNNGDGDDDAWEYLDSIDISVDIENTDNIEDIDDVEVQVIVLDSSGNDVTRDFEFDEEVVTDIGRLRDDEEESVNFIIEEVPADVSAGDYRLYIVAYSEGAEDEQCVSKYDRFDGGDLYYDFSVEPVDYEDAIVLKESDISIDTFCGQKSLELRIPVYNLYDEDEEKVLVEISNAELGINERKAINDLNDADTEEVTFFVSIPEFLERERYEVAVDLYFDWDDREDELDQKSYDENNRDGSINLNVLGCRGPAPDIDPSLASATEEGVELIVRAVVTNNGDDSEFEFMVNGYESWAELVSISPETTNLAEGESTEVVVVMNPTESGMQSFRISAKIGDDVYNQPISVNVREPQGLKALFGGVNEVTFYLLVGILGLLLLIFFILLVKVLRKSNRH